MLRRFAQVTTNPSAVIPFRLGFTSLKRGEDKCRAAEGVEVIGARADGDAGEFLNIVGFSGKDTVLLRGKAQCKGPEGILDIRVAVPSID
jgi:hypothetical protein